MFQLLSRVCPESMKEAGLVGPMFLTNLVMSTCLGMKLIVAELRANKMKIASIECILFLVVTIRTAGGPTLKVMESLSVTGVIVSREKNTLGIQPYFGPEDQGVILVELGDKERHLLSHCARNDLICCEVRLGDTNTISGPTIISRNLVEKSHVVGAMIAAVRAKGKLALSPSKVYKLYNRILATSLSVELPTVSQYLSYKANLYNLSSHREVLASFNLGESINAAELGSLLKGWYSSNDIRLLECLGMNKEEIRESYMRPDVLYNLYMENPMLVYSVPLEKAVETSKLLGIDTTEYMRAAGSLRVLAENSIKWSHCCMTANHFYGEQKLSPESISQLLERAIAPDTCDDTNVVYLRELRDMEVSVAATLHSIFTSEIGTIGPKRPDRNLDLKNDFEQNRAVENALKYNISIINGAAGTGKTTIVKNIIECLRLNNVSFACTSFTGCATARISECCGVEAEDMDLMIVKRANYSFSHLIIDEFSMTNIKLMYLFFQAFPGPYRITIIGDVQQLEPIGPGCILKQLIKSNCIPLTTLRTIHRVKTKDGVADRIIENSKRIAYWEDKPFAFILGDNFKMQDGSMQDLIAELKKMHASNMPTSDFTVMSPWKMPVSIINRTVQLLYNWQTPRCIKEAGRWTVEDQGKRPSPLEAKILDSIYHVGDRVMILKNSTVRAARGSSDEEIKMFNGQEGVVTEISSKGVTVDIRRSSTMLFPFYSKEGDPNVTFLTLCYACTVHKMQGKQTKKAIYFLGQDWSKFVNRNMTYTAITRAEEEVLLIGSPSNFCKSVNEVPYEKREYLYWRLQQSLPMDFMPIRDDRMMQELIERQQLMNMMAAAEAGSDDDCGPDEDDSY